MTCLDARGQCYVSGAGYCALMRLFKLLVVAVAVLLYMAGVLLLLNAAGQPLPFNEGGTLLSLGLIWVFLTAGALGYV